MGVTAVRPQTFEIPIETRVLQLEAMPVEISHIRNVIPPRVPLLPSTPPVPTTRVMSRRFSTGGGPWVVIGSIVGIAILDWLWSRWTSTPNSQSAQPSGSAIAVGGAETLNAEATADRKSDTSRDSATPPSADSHVPTPASSDDSGQAMSLSEPESGRSLRQHNYRYETFWEFVYHEDGLGYGEEAADAIADAMLASMRNAGSIRAGIEAAIPQKLAPEATAEVLAKIDAIDTMTTRQLAQVLKEYPRLFPGDIPKLLTAALISLHRDPTDLRSAAQRMVEASGTADPASMVMRFFDDTASVYARRFEVGALPAQRIRTPTIGRRALQGLIYTFALDPNGLEFNSHSVIDIQSAELLSSAIAHLASTPNDFVGAALAAVPRDRVNSIKETKLMRKMERMRGFDLGRVERTFERTRFYSREMPHLLATAFHWLYLNPKDARGALLRVATELFTDTSPGEIADIMKRFDELAGRQ